MRFVSVIFIGCMVLSGVVLAGAAEPANDVLSFLHSRKSVRQYTGAAVSKETLDKIIKAGMAAPTAVNKQPWSFVVVTDRKQLDALSSGLPTARGMDKAAAVIVVCTEPEKAHMQSRDFAVIDASLASENILLAINGLGLGGCWTAAYPYEDKVKHVRAVLGIPADVIPLNVIVVGVPAGQDRPKDKYKPERIHWEKW